MARRKKGRIINGWINLNKPADMTSTDAVAFVRRTLDAQKAGHGGTLDPLAHGVLPIALGEATKTVPYCQDRLKTYIFDVIWGETRDTDDAEGTIIATSPHRPAQEDIVKILPHFTGIIAQTPPQYSAIKVDGQRAYDRARDGKVTELAPRDVYIESLTLESASQDKVRLRCVCGKGTYIRALARDIAAMLGTCGYVGYLERAAVGAMTIENAISLAKLEEIGNSLPPEDISDDILLPVETVLDDIPALALNEQEAARLKNGQKLSFIARPDVERLRKAGIDPQDDHTALVTLNGRALAIVTVSGIDIQPLRLLNT